MEQTYWGNNFLGRVLLRLASIWRFLQIIPTKIGHPCDFQTIDKNHIFFDYDFSDEDSLWQSNYGVPVHVFICIERFLDNVPKRFVTEETSVGIILAAIVSASFYVEESPVTTMDVVDVAEEFDLFLADSDILKQKFGSKDWISHVVYLFTKLINFHSSISLKEYFSTLVSFPVHINKPATQNEKYENMKMLLLSSKVNIDFKISVMKQYIENLWLNRCWI